MAVAKSYSNYDQEVGYCQGLGFLAGIFLMHVRDAPPCCGCYRTKHKPSFP